MRYDFLIASLFFGLASFLIFAAIFLFTRKELLLGIRIVGLLAVANVLYLVGNGVVILSDLEPSILIGSHLSEIGALFIPFLWYLVSTQQKNKTVKISKRRLAILLSIPVISFVAIMLYPWGHVEGTLQWYSTLFYNSHTLVTNIAFGSGFIGISLQKGIMFYVLGSYNALLLLFSLYNYVVTLKASPKSTRGNDIVLVSLTVLLLGFSISTFFKVATNWIDLLPFLTGSTVIIAFFALYKYELFDLTPLAYRQVYEEASFPAFILDRDRFILSMNLSAKDLYDHRFDFKDRISLEMLYENDSATLSDLIAEKDHEIAFTKDGKKRYFTAKLEELYRYHRMTGYLLTYQDVTSHKAELEQMKYVATYDDLTKIYNRRVFYVRATEDFDEAVINKSPVSFIMFDLDNFKDVNDIYGHQAGDSVLAEMADIISKDLQDHIIFARYGGEEFVISLKNTSPEDAVEIANKIRKKLEKHAFVYTNHRIKITASFGVSGTSKQITKSFEQFLKDADDALYEAKNNGKNQVSLKE